jgi:hypothetical protein
VVQVGNHENRSSGAKAHPLFSASCGTTKVVPFQNLTFTTGGQGGSGRALNSVQHSLRGYSIFGIGVDRKHVLKWLFSKEKATLHALQKVYVYSENALKLRFSFLAFAARLKPCPFKTSTYSEIL